MAKQLPKQSAFYPRQKPLSVRTAAIAVVVIGIAMGAVAFALSRGLLTLWFGPPVPGSIGVNTAPPPGDSPVGMAWIPGGIFWMGCDDFPDARPIHKAAVDGFWMDKTE